MILFAHPLGDTSVELLRRLIAFPTESRTPNLDLINDIANRAEDFGAMANVVQGPSGRANLELRFGPDEAGGVLLAGHTDVVPAAAGWNTDPYILTEMGERLVGRGTADMKGFIAVALAVALSLDQQEMRVPLRLGLSYDEEIGCVGVPSLLAALSANEGVCPELIIVGEPTGLKLNTAHAGKVAYTMTATAPPAHSSLAPRRTSAIASAVRIATLVDAVNTRHSATTGVSTNVGTISGGTAVNVLAPECTLTFECRHSAEHDPGILLADVHHGLAECRAALEAIGGSLSLSRDAQYPALSTPEDDAAVHRLADIVGQPLAGPIEFGCEGGLYSEALRSPCVVFGPGDIADAHRPNEFVELSQLSGALVALDKVARTFCLPSRDNT